MITMEIIKESMKKIILKIFHFFSGHYIPATYDDLYVYCGCGKPLYSSQIKIVRDWVVPYLNNL